MGIALALRLRATSSALAFAEPLAIATSLCSSAAFAQLTGPITAVRCPPPPTASSRAARRTAVAAKRVPRAEALLATFQKTNAIGKTPGGVLHKRSFSVTLRWAHWEYQLPAGQVSLRSDNFAARRFYSTAALLRRFPTLQVSHPPVALPPSSLRGIAQPPRHSGPATNRH